MFHRGWFWIHARNGALAEQVVGVVRQYGVARVGELDAAAVATLAERGRWAGIIAELDGDRHAQLSRLRERSPALSMLAVVRSAQPSTINALTAQGIEVAMCPLDVRSITAFVQRAFAASFFPDDRVARMVDALASHCQLTAREVQLVAFCLGNEPRSRVRKRLGISENTLKTQVKGLLRKCNERSVDALAKNLLRAALLDDRSTMLDAPIASWRPLPRTA